MRSLPATLLAATVILTVAACGSGGETGRPDRAMSTTTTTSPAGAPTTEVSTVSSVSPRARPSVGSATTTTATALAPQAPADRAQVARAARITQLITEERWSDVRREFNDQLARETSEQQLAERWAQARRNGGRLLRIGDTFFAARSQDSAVWDTELDFERTDAKTRITFDHDDRVSALAILPT